MGHGVLTSQGLERRLEPAVTLLLTFDRFDVEAHEFKEFFKGVNILN
jgi:hypothetical protein